MDGNLKVGSAGNLFRGIPGTGLIERFKFSEGGGLEYRLDIEGVGHKKVGGHLTAQKL